MTAIDKTLAHERVFLPIDVIEPNPENPNEMSDAQFNMLYDNMESMGITDPLLVRRVGDKYRLVGGHHRLEVARLLDFEEVPCTIIEDEEFDDDKERFQMVRMNVIRGKMSPQKFVKIFDKLSEKYSDEVLAESFGFVDEEEFARLIKKTANTLPPEMQQKFKEAAKEVKTIDGLANILNHLFSEYGDTLPFGYMIFDFGGSDSIWLRMTNVNKKQMSELGSVCVENSRSMDHLVGYIFTNFLKDKDLQAKAIEKTPEIDIPEDVTVPTLDALKSPDA